MVNSSLISYISKLRGMGVVDEKIREQLIKSGWQETDVHDAMLPAVPTETLVIPPPPIPRFSMWISFQYFLLFITLWIWSVALGGIWNYAIDKHIPDNLAKSMSYDYSQIIGSSFLQGYLAAIIITYPFFIALFISINRQVELNPGVRNIKTRKLLMYFTIVVNFLYMISMLISTVFGFLGATSSTRTIPHLFVNLLIPGSICAFLLQEVNEDRKTSV